MSDQKELEVIDTEITPMTLIDRAMSNGVDISQLEGLFDLQERYEKNESIKIFNSAMSNFQSICPAIPRTKKAHNSNYTPLDHALKIIRPSLTECELTVDWKTEQVEQETLVTCIISHVTGHSKTTSLKAGAETSGSKNAIQAIGSTVSYLQRYTMFSALGLASGEMDDDGGSFGGNVEYINTSQAANIRALLSELGREEQRFCSWAKVPEIEQIPEVNYNAVIKQLEAWRK